jgi:hypothetical protein
LSKNDLLNALWSLKEDAAWAWKDALEGHKLDLHKLGLDWKRVEQATIEMERDERDS